MARARQLRPLRAFAWSRRGQPRSGLEEGDLDHVYPDAASGTNHDNAVIARQSGPSRHVDRVATASGTTVAEIGSRSSGTGDHIRRRKHDKGCVAAVAVNSDGPAQVAARGPARPHTRDMIRKPGRSRRQHGARPNRGPPPTRLRSRPRPAHDPAPSEVGGDRFPNHPESNRGR